VFEAIEQAAGRPVVILNHARDLHSGVRPFGPRWFNAAVAESLEAWPLAMDAMEVINSGATQSDALQLFHDWMSLLNRGLSITPVGSSDSHDVTRHFVGQGRTYIRVDDSDPAAIDVAAAIDSFRQGRVLVSYGLITELQVGDAKSGDIATIEGATIRVAMRVLGPHWTQAEEVQLYMNGEMVWQQSITPQAAGTLPRGVHWSGTLDLPKPPHDVHLVAIARGSGIDHAYWRTAKPYQPKSIQWQSQVLGCSGALWIDADGDGNKTSAREYATRLNAQWGDQLERLLMELAPYDVAVAMHAAQLHHVAEGAVAPMSEALRSALADAAPSVRGGFSRYYLAWRDSQLARAAGSDP
jgi:hypothetical protein